MSGIKALRYLQLSGEATPGTKVAATTIFRGTGLLNDTRTVTFPDEDSGYVGGTDRAYSPKIEAALSMDATPLTFEQVPYIFNAATKLATATQDGTAGSGYVYAHPAATTAVNTVKSYTIEGGDNQQGYVMEYGLVEKIKITGKPGEAWMIQTDWFGRQVAKQAKTAALSLPTVEEALFGKTTLAIDAVSGTLGTTTVSSTLMGAEIDITTGYHGTFTGDNLYFTTHNIDGTKQEITLKITYLHNGSAVSEYDAFVAGTPRQLRLKTIGSSLTTSGTYTNKTAQFDFAGKYESWDKLTDIDGDDVVVATLRCRYNATAALFFLPTFVNQLTTLP